jgi:drug/metabolite transporter (DMT)-like permease
LNQKSLAHLALLGTNIFFAINFTAVKYLINGKYLQPFGLNIIRVGITSILLWILFFLKPQKILIQKKHYGRLVLCALTGIAINQLLFVKGLSLTYSIHASLLMLTTPILITIIAAWVLKERITILKIIGLLLGVAGAMVLILLKEKDNSNPKDIVLGDVLIIINAISYTIYFILVKPLMVVYNPIMILRIIFSIGFFMMLPFCWTEFNAIPWQMYSTKTFSILAVVVLGGTFLAYLFNIYGIKILGASVSGSYIYLQPLFAAAIAISFLNEHLSTYKLIAGALIFTGVFLANKQPTNANNNSK